MSTSATRPARSYPLRTLLLWLVVGLVVPMALLAAFVVQRLEVEWRATAERRLLEEARELSRTIDDDLGDTLRTLIALAESPALTVGNTTVFREEARRYLASRPIWHVVVLHRPDGREVMSTDRQADTAVGVSADIESLRRVVETRQPMIDALRPFAPRRLGFSVRVPVTRGTSVPYVLSAVITPERLAGRLQFRTDDTWLRTVLDAHDVIVARSRSAEDFVGRRPTDGFLQLAGDRAEGAIESVTLDGEPVYSGVSRGAYAGWRAVVAVPRSVVDADSRRTITLLGIVGGLLLGLGGAASLLIARRIARDISLATQAATALVAGQPMPVGRPWMAEVRQLSDALAQSADLLRERERERDARVAQADAARAEAEAANRAKDEFLAMLGHELRNPLAPVVNALHVAERRGGVLDDRERRIVERQVRHMTRLVDDLLDMSRLHHDTIELHIESCDLREIVDAAVEMTRGLAEAHHVVTVDVPDGLGLQCDAHRITQVIANLLGNAAKYTAAGGTIRLAARREGDEVAITCDDNGMGLPPDLLEKVFEPFVQGARGIDRRQGGLGVGLAVARGFVERHGGRITAFSEGEGRGSRFEVRLPASSPIAPAPAPRTAETTPARPQVRVLVVEDTADVCEMLVVALSMSGVDARGVGSARAAIETAAAWPPDVAVLDIGLPDMDGYQLARELRARAGDRPLRLMALTGYGGETHAAEAQAAGFDTFLVKPVGIDALLQAIADTTRE